MFLLVQLQLCCCYRFFFSSSSSPSPSQTNVCRCLRFYFHSCLNDTLLLLLHYMYRCLNALSVPFASIDERISLYCLVPSVFAIGIVVAIASPFGCSCTVPWFAWYVWKCFLVHLIFYSCYFYINYYIFWAPRFFPGRHRILDPQS